MKLAIIGKGTAGTIAAAYLSSRLRDTKIDLYYSEDIATIGVGEGGGPRLTRFLDDLGIDKQDFCLKTQATKKWGILFENWGSRPNQSVHHFNPAKEQYSYHFDASQLHDLLLERSKVNVYQGNVSSIEKTSEDVSNPSLVFEGEKRFYNYIIDASGFLKCSFKDLSSKSDEALLIANQACLVQIERCAVETYEYVVNDYHYDSLTLSKALQHGWLFVIPLQKRVSFGYIHNDKMSNVEDIRKELFSEIARLNSSFKVISERTLSFNSFTSSKFLDKCVFNIGNRAAFAEPLEATAIEFILRECDEMFALLSSESIYSNICPLTQQKLFNYRLNQEMQRIALFIGWHYSNGSIHDTDFWRQSKIHYKHLKDNLIDKKIVDEFDQWLNTLTYTQSCPSSPFFGWSFRSFEEVSNAIS